jgi:glycosyltransferase involved in cell wall biosynthesis
VYDCWFLRPELAGADVDPAVRRAGAVLRRAVGDGAQVVTSSAASARAVVALLDADPQHVHAIHLGPPALGSAVPVGPLAVPTGRYVLALGTVERRKNVPTLVDAFGRLGRAVPDVDLVLAGRDGDDADVTARHVERLPRDLQERIHRRAAVDDAEKEHLLRGASVLAYPSLDEGFGFPVLEAQLAGVPVVASTAGSIPEIAGDGALLAPADDAERLASQLVIALDDEARRAALVAAGRHNLCRFSWDKTAAQLVALYHLLAGTP